MKENNIVAAILTVAFYTGRGGAMNLPQIIATYEEISGMLAAKNSGKSKKKR